MYKILVVENQPIIRSVYQKIIARESELYIWNEVQSGEEALAVLFNELPDIVILDLSLPGMSGMTLLHELQERYPSLPVLVFSGMDEFIYAPLVLKAGASGYVDKSYVAQVFVDAIWQVLDGKPYISEQMMAIMENHLGTFLTGVNK